MGKFNYWCEHCTCGLSGKARDFVIDKPDSKEKRAEYCENNPKKKLKLLGFSFSISKTMDKETRIKALKKRSKDHHNREIKEKKAAMIKRFDETGYN